MCRCLEEGAEEFFLKPVRKSDVNKLKPHLMKTKDNNHQKQENNEASETTEVQPPQPPPPQPLQQQQQQQQQHSNNKKRKAVEAEGLSPDRTRPRYSGLTAV